MIATPSALEKSTQPPKAGLKSQLKHELLKQVTLVKSQELQLPRFYSSDEKHTKKKIVLSRNKNENPFQLISKASYVSKKKQQTHNAKTEKTDTPTKQHPLSLNKIKLVQQKWSDIKQKRTNTRKSQAEIKGKGQKQTIEKHERRHENDHLETHNLNKIRYKVSNKGSVQANFNSHKKIVSVVETEGISEDNFPKTSRQHKAMTQEAVKKSESIIKSKTIVKNEELFSQYLRETQNRPTLPEYKMRTMSTFESVLKPRAVLNSEEKSFLRVMCDILKKTIKNINNLDFPQAYIVSEKIKHEKRCHLLLEEKFKKQFKNCLINTRFAYYLCAHLILLSINAKLLLAIFTKLLENHQIIMNLFGLINEKRNSKFHSLGKASSNDLNVRNHEERGIVLENRGSSLHRNNQIVRKMLMDFFNKKTVPYSDLFISLQVSSAQIDSFQYVSFIDKTLKWQILKMPTFPFLPQSDPKYKYYLILDLDETLIHFDSDNNNYHIRPHVEEFLKKMAAYFEITIFTAATKEYADEIINEIDQGSYVKYRLYRNHLTFLEGQSIKDISMLGRDLKTTIIVDNLQTNFRLHRQNGVMIKSWYGGSDDALCKLQILLMKIVFEFPDDLRKGLKLYHSYINRQIAERTKSLKLSLQI